MKTIDISKANREPLSILSTETYRDRTNKGWSYSSVYSLEELRDIYMLLIDSDYKNLQDFTENKVKQVIIPRGKEWTERRVLELLNAIVNIEWLEKDNLTGRFSKTSYSPNFKINSFGHDLSDSDKCIFQEVFFRYIRFREFIQLYLSNLSENLDFVLKKESNPVYSIRKSKYTDTFFSFIENSLKVKFIPDLDGQGKKNTPCMMFWDVFTTWGKKLDLMEFFTSRMFDTFLADGRGFTCSYFLSKGSIEIPNILTLISRMPLTNRMIDVSYIIWSLCTQYRLSLEDAKNYVVNQYIDNKRFLTPVRTSEIFINKSEKHGDEYVAYPQYKDSFISHFILK